MKICHTILMQKPDSLETQHGLTLGAGVEGFFYGKNPSQWPKVSEAVNAVVSLGLGVEVWATRGENDSEPGPEGINEIRKTCDRAPFVSMHTRHKLWRWDPHGLQHEIWFCEAINARTLVLHRESLGLYDPSSRPDFPAIKRLAEAAREAGVQLVLENGRDTLWALDLILDEIGDDPTETNLGICIDIGHAHLSKDAGRQPIENYLKRYREQLIHLHLHDNLGKQDNHRLLGKGSVDWEKLFNVVEAIRYNGPAVLEIHTKGKPLEAIAQACDFINGLCRTERTPTH